MYLYELMISFSYSACIDFLYHIIFKVKRAQKGLLGIGEILQRTVKSNAFCIFFMKAMRRDCIRFSEPSRLLIVYLIARFVISCITVYLYIHEFASVNVYLEIHSVFSISVCYFHFV